MGFTDEDLKRLEATFTVPEYHQDIAEDVAIWILNSQCDLIARLEAAEKVIEGLQNGASTVWLDEALHYWRKSKGD